MSNEKIRFIAKLMGAWILAYERRRISVRRISPPAKVTCWISDKTFFFLSTLSNDCQPPPLGASYFPWSKRETRVTRASDWWRSTLYHGKEKKERRSNFSSVFSFPPSPRPYIVVSCKLFSFSRWLEGICNQSPQSVGTARCSASDRGQERHEICYERYFC